MALDAKAGKPDKAIPIHIDRQTFQVPPGSLTGTALRALPTPPIGQDRELFRVIPSSDDVVVGDADQVELRPGMHLYSAAKCHARLMGLLPAADEEHLRG